MKVTLTIRGLYNWDNTLFAEMLLPTSINKPALIDTILEECEGLEILYPDPFTMKRMIGDWSHQRGYAWDRLAATQTVDYNAIHNYDRTETWTDTDSETEAATRSGQVSGTGSNVETHDQTAFNTDQLKTAQEVTDQNTAHQTASSTDNSNRNRNATRQGRAYGNIGVTTTQDMLRQELDFWGSYNVYRIIAQDFKKQFCIMVY